MAINAPITTGFTFTGVAVTGASVPDAELSLKPGLNVVSGASDTGKTHILECIDFMLGGSTSPERFPENERYESIYAGVKGRTASEITLRRGFGKGAFERLNTSLPGRIDAIQFEILDQDHSEGKTNTASHLFLSLSGLVGKRVRKNARNETQSLSFRNVARLIVVSEETMWGKTSPVLSENKVENTVETSVFRLLITGIDDSNLVGTPNPKTRKERLAAQIEMLNQLIAQREAQPPMNSNDSEDWDGILRTIDAELSTTSETNSTLQADISAEETLRSRLWEALQPQETRRRVVDGLQARFQLLASHYESDLARIAAMTEAGEAFGQLDTVPCPMCGRTSGDQKSEQIEPEIDSEAFNDACEKESQKIRLLAKDLLSTRERLAAERNELEGSIQELSQALRASSLKLQEILLPQVRASKIEFTRIIANRSTVVAAIGKRDELATLVAKRRELELQLVAKQKSPKAAKATPTAGVDKFCLVVEAILRDWRWPNLQRVSFDEKNLDIIINGRIRGSFGKGYRAFAHAAFVIGIMRYCRENGLAHPGLVVLDSPLVTLKKPDVPQGEEISYDMKDAFYESLQNNPHGDQIIVLENDEPPQSIHKKINYLHFSGERTVGRFGFYLPIALPPNRGDSAGSVVTPAK